MPELPVRPPALGEGDVVGIVAPASPVREDLLARGEQALRALGFVPRRAANLLARDRYTAGAAAARASDLNRLFAEREVRAVWVARGGYGSPPLVPLLDAAALRADPKPIIGASDATALLLWALRAGVAALHGPMVARELQEGRYDPGELRRILCSAEPPGPLTDPGVRALHPGRARGPLVGGCLSLVVASLGTPWEIDTDGALLFLEDVDTKPYQVDRMLTQLHQAGKLDRVAGIAFGQMPGCVQAPGQGYTLEEVLADLTAPAGVPVVYGLPCGHTHGVHRPLPFGVPATLDTDLPGLVLDSPLVR